MNSENDKNLPASIEAEAAVLGSILLNREAIIAVAPWLKSAHFYQEKNAWIYEAALACYEAGVPPDTLTISEELRRRNRLEAVGGYAYLNELDEGVPTSYHIEYYARQVERTATARSLIVAGGVIAALGYDEQQDVDAALAKAQAALDQISGQRVRGDEGLVMIADVVDRLYHQLEAAMASGNQVQIGLQTGYRDLDEITGGLQKSDLIILAARPGVGKSSLAESLAYNIGSAGHRVDLFSLEMSRDQNLHRLIAMDTGINVQQVRQLRMNDDGLRIYMDAMARINAFPLAIDDEAALNVRDIRARILRRQAKSGPPELVIIDYLQLMGGVRRADNRVQEVSEISRGLKQLAKELNIPILALSQLSRAVEGRTSHVPMLSDLRECVVGSTRLIDADSGHMIPIRNVQPGSRILGLDAEHHIRPFAVERVWSTGVKPVFTVATRTGRRITATGNHPLLTPSGWCSVSELRPGDLLATAMRLPAHGTDNFQPDLCRLLGYLTGDGTYQHHRGVGFISSDPATFADVVSIINHRFPDVSLRMKHTGPQYQEADFVCLQENGYGKPYGNPLREWLREIGVEGQRDSTKHVPPFVFETGLNAAQFIAGYLSSDGCVKVRIERGKSPKWEIHFDTVSRVLAEDIQALLFRIGVVSTVNNGYTSKKGTMPIYRINVSIFADNLRHFALIVPALGRKGELLKALLKDSPKSRTGNHIFTLPKEVSALLASRAKRRDQGKRMRRDVCAEWAERLDDNELRQWAYSDLLWEPIVSIESSGEDEVFDISVPGCGNFIANGIVAHNSGALEQDADIVMFIYREELYEKDTDKKGIAEIHIAKHRNGPTGVIPMRFDASTTRFMDLDYKHTLERRTPYPD